MLWWRKDLAVTIFVQKFLEMPLTGWKINWCIYTCGINNRKSTVQRANLCFASLSSGTKRKDEPSAVSFETLSEASSSKLRLPRKDKTDGPDSNHL